MDEIIQHFKPGDLVVSDKFAGDVGVISEPGVLNEEACVGRITADGRNQYTWHRTEDLRPCQDFRIGDYVRVVDGRFTGTVAIIEYNDGIPAVRTEFTVRAILSFYCDNAIRTFYEWFRQGQLRLISEEAYWVALRKTERNTMEDDTKRLKELETTASKLNSEILELKNKIEKNKKITPEEFDEEVDRIKKEYGGDTESVHAELDTLMEKTLKQFGFEKGIEKIENTDRWYA